MINFRFAPKCIKYFKTQHHLSKQLVVFFCFFFFKRPLYHILNLMHQRKIIHLKKIICNYQ